MARHPVVASCTVAQHVDLQAAVQQLHGAAASGCGVSFNRPRGSSRVEESAGVSGRHHAAGAKPRTELFGWYPLT